MRMRRWLFVLALACIPACNDDTPSTPTPPPSALNLTGRWISDLTVQGVAARMTWTLAHSGTAVTGPVLVALPSGTVIMNGALTGTLNGSTLTYTIAVGPNGIPSQPACTGQVGGTMAVASTPTSMSGTLAVTSSTCAIQFPNSSVTMTKQ